MLRSVSRRFTLRDLLAGTACPFDLLPCRRRELGRVHGELLGQLSIAETLDAVVDALDYAGLSQRSFVDRGAVFEALQIGQVHDRMFFLEDVGEPALRQPAMQRHLAAFEAEHPGVTRARLLAFLASAGSLAVAGAGTAPHALLSVTGAFLWFEVTEFHLSPSERSVVRGPRSVAGRRYLIAVMAGSSALVQSTTSTRCGILAIIPRTSFVSTRSHTRCIFPRPSALRVSRISTGQPMPLRICRTLMVLSFLAAMVYAPTSTAATGAASSSMPRSALYSASLRSCLRASNVALTTL